MTASVRIANIQAAPAKTQLDKIKKALAIASVVLNHNASMNELLINIGSYPIYKPKTQDKQCQS